MIGTGRSRLKVRAGCVARFRGARGAVRPVVRATDRRQALQDGGHVADDWGVRQRAVWRVMGGEVDAGRAVPGPDEVDAVHANTKHQVGPANEIEDTARSVRGQGAGVEPMAARKPAAGLDLGDDGNVGRADQAGEVFGDGWRARFEAEDGDRAAGSGEASLDVVELRWDGRRGRRAVPGWDRRCGDGERGGGTGNGEMGRAGHALDGSRPGGRDDRGQVVRADTGGVFDRGGHCAGNVVDLMPLAGGFVGRDVRRNAEDRRTLEGGLGETGEEVGGAGSEGADADAGPAGELAFGVGHVGGGRLVVSQDELDAVALEGVEHREHLAAGDAVGATDALPCQEGGYGFGDGYVRHGR